MGLEFYMNLEIFEESACLHKDVQGGLVKLFGKLDYVLRSEVL